MPSIKELETKSGTNLIIKIKDSVDKLLNNISKEKLSIEDIKGIVIQGDPKFYNMIPKSTGYNEIVGLNNATKDYGFHYGINGTSLVKYVSNDYKINSFNNFSSTYISSALFNEKPNEQVISIIFFINEEQNYCYTEATFIYFLVELIRSINNKKKNNKLTAKDIWRGFDLSKKDYGPFHLLDKDIFEKYINIIDLFLDNTYKDNETVNDKNETQIESDKNINYVYPFKSKIKTDNDVENAINKYVNNIYKEHKDDITSYINNFQPWDKDIEEAVNYNGSASETEIKNSTYKTNNSLQYKVIHNNTKAPCNCSKPYDTLDAEETTEQTMVEPIYPDLIVPPGGSISKSNGNSPAATQSNSTTELTVEEFEKRQKTFSMDNLKEAKKETSGRPINCEDNFPVDEQIKKLEEHFPKVKIDNIKFDFTEDNHMKSALGKAMCKNFNMVYDICSEISKRTEKRLVKIENNLSTVMRNLFRLSSRININCTYYGGQSIYGKKFKFHINN